MSKPALIIDDEITSIETLRHHIERYCPQVEVVGHALGVASGIKMVQEIKPELIFLDVEMKDGTGFDLLEQLPSTSHLQVIFVTAYDHYAIKAFRVCALDYLLKPVDPDLLIHAVEKAVSISEKVVPDRINILKSNSKDQQKIILPSKNEFIVAEIEKIIRCQADGNYTIIFFENNQQELVSRTLKEFDEMLGGEKFVRVHKSHLINMKYVERYLPKDSIVAMKDGSKVEISRRRKDIFLQYFFNQ